MTILTSFVVHADMADDTDQATAETLIATAITDYLYRQGLVANVAVTCIAMTVNTNVAGQPAG